MARLSLDRLGGWIGNDDEEEHDMDELLADLEDTEVEACLSQETKSPLEVPPATLPVYMTIHR